MHVQPFLRMDNIRKRFGSVIASAGATIEVEEGEIYALLGENGAGKSVLMNILCGILTPDEGEIVFRGAPLRLGSPEQAVRHRIGMVHQHFMLVPSLTVTENYMLGQGSPLRLLSRMRAVSSRISELSDRYGLDVRPDSVVRNLSVGEQQRVEILKVLYHGIDLLILDEPTAVLTPQETDRLLDLLRGLVKEGKTVIFISHKLDEVMRVSDRVSVMRDGRVVFTTKTSETDPRELARMMVGRDVLMDLPRTAAQPGRVVLAVTNLHCNNELGLPAVRDISLEVRQGEIVGIAGVSGNGQSELALAMTGLVPTTAGSIKLNGEELRGLSPSAINRRPFAHVPEDRHKMGIVLPLPLTENVILQRYNQAPFSVRGLLDLNAIADHARDLVRRFKVKARDVDVLIHTLSGGNQQKLVVARELARRPDFLLINQLTRGIDIGAMEFVMQEVLKEREAGKAIMLISTELEELFAICDRILVIYEGRIIGEVPPDRSRLDELGLLMAGKRIDTAPAATLM
ncbi:ABC transporter ATP-binding protein [Mesorhizobium sp. ES1-4]|uniref:ABC transporter ATP-binding protein n=1 Tax=Mesorhizobium sp. ES1-4 TaxID=2876627 RepID=UPI001CCD3FD1|nr:ABC transporter ATP-binding protein [Mesorhizobium sp. ES1-4]MBZ9797202.1 ABC transporter ATP-binding protein [Mesorhizobium sp. ES1-4]